MCQRLRGSPSRMSSHLQLSFQHMVPSLLRQPARANDAFRSHKLLALNTASSIGY